MAAAAERAKKRTEDHERKLRGCKILAGIESGKIVLKSYKEIIIPPDVSSLDCFGWCHAKFNGKATSNNNGTKRPRLETASAKTINFKPTDTESWHGCPWCDLCCCGKVKCVSVLTRHMQVCGQNNYIPDSDDDDHFIAEA